MYDAVHFRHVVSETESISEEDVDSTDEFANDAQVIEGLVKTVNCRGKSNNLGRYCTNLAFKASDISQIETQKR